MTSITPGYVYLIHAIGSNLYKIGLTTRTPEKRLKDLNGSQFPYQLTLSHYIYVDDVHKIENELHQHFKSYHHHNEWFNFTERMISDVIDTMNNYDNINNKESLQDNDAISIFIAFVMIVSVITFALSGFKKASNPKYSECVSNRGGVACDRFLNSNKLTH